MDRNDKYPCGKNNKTLLTKNESVSKVNARKVCNDGESSCNDKEKERGRPNASKTERRRKNDVTRRTTKTKEMKDTVQRDGLKAWLSVIASGLNYMLISMGLGSVGAFYQELLVTFQEGQARTAWTASIQLAVGAILGIFICPQVKKYGCRIMTRIGSVLGFIGYVTASFSTNLVHVYFTFGVLVGLSNGFLFFSSAISIQVQFARHRALATALSTCGVSLAMFIFPPLARLLTDLYGWRGCLLNLGGVYLNAVVSAQLLADRETTNRCTMACATPPSPKAEDDVEALEDQRKTQLEKCVIKKNGGAVLPKAPLDRSSEPKAGKNDSPTGKHNWELPAIEEESKIKVFSKVPISEPTTEDAHDLTKLQPDHLQDPSMERRSGETRPRSQVITSDVHFPTPQFAKTSAPTNPVTASNFNKETSNPTTASDLNKETSESRTRSSAQRHPSAPSSSAVYKANETDPSDDEIEVLVTRPKRCYTLPSRFPERTDAATYMQIVPVPEPIPEAAESTHTSCASSDSSVCTSGGWGCWAKSNLSMTKQDTLPVFVSPLPMFLSPIPSCSPQHHPVHELHHPLKQETGNYFHSLPAFHVTPSVRYHQVNNNNNTNCNEACSSETDCNVQIQDLASVTLSKDSIYALKSALITLKHFLTESTDFSLLKEVHFVLFLMGSILNIFGYLIPVLFIPIRATCALGLTDKDNAALLSSIGISITCGRLVSGALGDSLLANFRAAHYGVPIILVGLLNIISTFLTTFHDMMVYSVMYGFFTGFYLVAQQPLLVEILSLEKFAKSMGILTLFTGTVTLLCQPFAGLLVDLSGHYELPFIVCGILQMIGGALILSTKLVSTCAKWCCCKQNPADPEETIQDEVECKISQV